MAGLALIVLGTAMVVIAAARFVRIAKNIDRKDVAIKKSSDPTGSGTFLSLTAFL